MQRISGVFALTGLLGIPIFALIGLGLPIGLGVALWAAVGVTLVCAGVWKHKGLSTWLRQPLDGADQPLLVGCAGLIFAAAGTAIIAVGAPSNGPEAMNRQEIVFFGSIFLLTGIGLCGIVTSPRRT
jgi:hypothetical protein